MIKASCASLTHSTRCSYENQSTKQAYPDGRFDGVLVSEMATPPLEPPQDERIFNRRQPDGTFRPLSEFFSAPPLDPEQIAEAAIAAAARAAAADIDLALRYWPYPVFSLFRLRALDALINPRLVPLDSNLP